MGEHKTLGDIAREQGVPLHRVQYAVLSHGIKPARRAGKIRLFDAQAVERIVAVLQNRRGV
jgi:DNA-binding transcriptional MerR regulator